MRKCHLDLLAVLRAEIADLYRLRGEDNARLRFLEQLTHQSAPAEPDLSITSPADLTPIKPR